ncbi:MAG: undecaprenyldiphospho-muramoylpentapeptide beta-N-acetylglucosaminyltransferase [Pseudomonadota bacterium]|jgi:UDP-N-acetylglucosamine--N-acetylmuramyl-(pentapeptide) pyrophosphoryl-undecaprenol N-acetylglucosamine transferase
MTNTVVITAAGTGGHVFPGLAVAKYLQQKNFSINWIGGSGMEVDLVPKYGITFTSVPFSGIRGKGILKLFKAPFQLMKAIGEAKKLLKEIKPSLVLAMGGYISVPVGIAAKLLGIPLLIHEQNAIPGMSNKLLNRIAKKSLLGFDGSIEGGVYTGNPIREHFSSNKEISEVVTPKEELKVLVIGGSLGAAILNEVVPKAIQLIGNAKKIEVVHQSGKKHIQTLVHNYSKALVKAHAVDFIEDMKAAYEWADVVICRAGAMTISELATVGVPSILIPFPSAVDDHQTKNAQVLAKAKAAWLVPQSQLTAQRLADILKNATPDKLRQMSLKARLHSHQNATQKVGDICIEVLKNG